MGAKGKEWRNYEDVARFLLDNIAEEVGLERVEGKQDLVGQAGTTWEIDAKGVRLGDEGIVLIECKRYSKKRVNQETVGGFAYRIKDLGSSGGVLVSPLGFQSGARLIADREGIIEVRLDANSTREQYVLHFLDKIFVGVHFQAEGTLSATVRVVNKTEG